MVNPIKRRGGSACEAICVGAGNDIGVSAGIFVSGSEGQNPVDRRHAVRMAPIIHASDTATAYFVMQSGLVPRDTGRLIVTISAINTLLSLLMQKRSKD